MTAACVHSPAAHAHTYTQKRARQSRESADEEIRYGYTQVTVSCLSRNPCTSAVCLAKATRCKHTFSSLFLCVSICSTIIVTIHCLSSSFYPSIIIIIITATAQRIHIEREKRRATVDPISRLCIISCDLLHKGGAKPTQHVAHVLCPDA